MTEIPEKIWAFLDGPMVGLFVSGGFTADGTEYTRSDHAQALVAAAYEAAAAHCRKYVDTFDNITEIYTSVRALTPADALAAQRKRDAETYRMAMEAAAVAAKGEGQSEWFNPVQAICTLPNPFEETDDE